MVSVFQRGLGLEMERPRARTGFGRNGGRLPFLFFYYFSRERLIQMGGLKGHVRYSEGREDAGEPGVCITQLRKKRKEI